MSKEGSFTVQGNGIVKVVVLQGFRGKNSFTVSLFSKKSERNSDSE